MLSAHFKFKYILFGQIVTTLYYIRMLYGRYGNVDHIFSDP